MATLNRYISLRSRPVGLPRVADFELGYSPLPSPGGGEVLVRALCFALDPHLRPRMNAACIGGPSLALGAVVEATAVGRVVRSEDAAFGVGDAVEGLLGWQEHALLAARDLRRLDPAPVPLSAALGVLGLPGLTAYFG
ncbi:MAG TPA: NADP-dependent oxidoreductase, partial [Thermoanaerobaculia bacterium]|nr:NADP-dependent oxidoreductase [Thermoanaerobaculia bacterium]